MLLDEGWISFFVDRNLQYGISIDGDKIASDRHRFFHNGKSSFYKVSRAVYLFSNSLLTQKLFMGVIAVIDLKNDPIDTYEFLNSLGPPQIGFNLPHGNYVTKPAGKERSINDISYGIWLWL